MIKNRNILCLLLISALLPIFICDTYSKNFISDSLYPAQRDKLLFEVGAITFKGNKSFTPNNLIDAVNSKMNSLSIQHDVFQYYLDNFRRIPETPKVLEQSLIVALQNLSHEIKYFNESTAELDIQTLWHYYNTNGFHFAEISYSFYPNHDKEYNVLTFNIKENKRYLIDTIVYHGLANLDSNVEKRVNKFKSIKKGDTYSELKIITEVNGILNILLNNGYFYAELVVEPISINTEKESDSITVTFRPGIRQMITNLNFVDSLKKQKLIVRNMKQQQLDFKVGDWYNRSKIQSSINNLHSLGTFELVSIDTSSIFSPHTDSSLSMLVFTQYRKQKEWGIGLFVNSTQLDNATNLGAEANIMHRNWGGAAQSGNVFANARIRNVSRLLAGQKGEYEGQIGFRVAQPLIWSIENMRIGASGSFYYSLSTVDKFNISAWFLPIRFPIKLTNATYLNQINVDFNFEFQNPVNYVDVIREFKESDTNSARLRQALVLYRNLYDYLKSPGTTLLTSNVFGVTLLGDSRNHPFNPTSGDNFSFSVDGWNIFLSHPWIAGIAKYLRVQTAYNLFLPMNENAVSAFKFRGGVINLVDDFDAYIPFDRQFFSGGANSVRGWLSRELHYSPLESEKYAKSGEKTDLVINESNYSLFSNVLGSSAILEGSYEFRYSIPAPKGIDESLAEQISNIGVTLFVDYGNAYHWFAEGNANSNMIWYEYITKMAWAAGFGFSYNTPIGPVRLDFGFPIYRPGFNVPDYHIWDNSKIFRDMKVHFGIGHSF